MRLSNILEKNSSLEIDNLVQNDTKDNYTHSLKPKTSNLKNDISDLKSDIEDMQINLNDLSSEVSDDVGRMSYVRQLTGEFLEYLMTLNSELETQVKIPNSTELINKMLGRSERKRYYMSKFRL